MSARSLAVLILALGTIAAGCSDSSEQPTTTSVVAAAPAATTTSAPPTTVATTTMATTTEPPPAPPLEGPLIAFSSDRIGASSMFVLDPADGEIRQLTFGVDPAVAPSWSPDGRRLAYTAISGSTTKLMVLDVAAAGEGEMEPVALTDGSATVDEPAWAPDGSQLAYSMAAADGTSQVWVVGTDGANPTLLIENAERPAWSPAGDQVAFVRFEERDSAIAVLDVASGDIVLLTESGGRDAAPAWSPDGRYIAYSGGRENVDIWLIEATGGEPRALTSDPEREWWPCWLADDVVAYARFDLDSLHDIWTVNIDSGEQAALVDDRSDDWWPGCLPES